MRVHHLASAKKDGTKLVMLTAYDAVTAQILDAAGTDMLLVGDSIGNVILGYDSTLPVELDEMVVATRSVARATLIGLVCSLGIETAQYLFSWGYSDADDVICNVAGAWLGAVVAAGASRGARSVVLWCIAAVGALSLAVYAALGLSA